MENIMKGIAEENARMLATLENVGRGYLEELEQLRVANQPLAPEIEEALQASHDKHSGLAKGTIAV